MKKLNKALKNIFENKLNDKERYYIAVVILSLLDFLKWLQKHNKLTNILFILLFLTIILLGIYIIGYFFLGLNYFLDSIGQHHLVELELKTFQYMWENNPWNPENHPK